LRDILYWYADGGNEEMAKETRNNKEEMALHLLPSMQLRREKLELV